MEFRYNLAGPMLPPRAAHLMLRHFDAIDEAVSRRLTRKRPWSEPALTSLLCDLLDEDVQNEEALAYSLEELNKDLAEMDGLFSMSFKIDTHEYDGAAERWITQADLGLIIKCENYLMSSDSWEACWLLQAKRAYPDSRNPPVFSDRSRFAAYDPAQHVRIEQRQQTVGHDFVRYLFSAPRPSALDPTYRAKLAYLRSRRLAEDIFDYTLGLDCGKNWDHPTVRSQAGCGWRRYPAFRLTSRPCTVTCFNPTHHLHGFLSATFTLATEFAIS